MSDVNVPLITSSERSDLYDQELIELRDKMTQMILQIRRSRGNERDEKVKQVKTLLERAKKVYNKLNAVIKKEMDPNKKEQLTQLKKLHKSELAKIRTQLTLAISQAETVEQKEESKLKSFKEESKNRESVEIKKSERKVNTKFTEKESNHDQQLQDQLEQELFKEIFETQKECLDIINRLNKRADQTTEIAIESAELLAKQKEQLMSIDRQLDELGANTKRARRELAVISRRLATDKCIIIGFVLVVCAILGFLGFRLGRFIYLKTRK